MIRVKMNDPSQLDDLIPEDEYMKLIG